MGAWTPGGAMERQTICFPHYGTQEALQCGDPNFKHEIDRLYCSAENNALEELVKLKKYLQTLTTDEFWSALTEGISSIVGSEMSFVCKRILEDDQVAPFGDPGSCLMGTVFHYRRSDGSKITTKQTKYFAYSCPCAYMRHEKVFLISEKFEEFITNNPNTIPTPVEAYLAVPLFTDSKCFAHFGVMYTKIGIAQKQLSWAFIELLLHSLEDLVLQRFVEGPDFAPKTLVSERQAAMTHDAVTVSQSLRPYAGSLSHELRTPMQGIVGMLDVMYATVEEAVTTEIDSKQRQIFQDLKENIEVVQDSSRRAVEAADNVVHAYDMDMSVPEAAMPLALDDMDSLSPYSTTTMDRRPEIFVAGSNLPLSRKRRRDEAFSRQSSNASNSKFQKLDGAQAIWQQSAERSQDLKEGFHQAEQVHSCAVADATPEDAPSAEDAELAAGSFGTTNRIISPGLRHTNMREIFQYVINEGLKLGGRPDMALAQETAYGEQIEVRSRGSDGTAKGKTIEWTVHPNVPSTLFIDEKDLTKLISCVFLNAIKFSDQNGGRVGVYARMSSRGRYISIKVSDNGPGIPAAFLPKLFQPFSRENASITRQSEGLGLGLMVAKGIARKLGGDLLCIKAETEGPDHGSEFEIRIPLAAGDTVSRPSSPMPRKAIPASLHLPKTPPSPLFPPKVDSPTRLTQALHESVARPPVDHDDRPSTPLSPRSQPRFQMPDPAAAAVSSPISPPVEKPVRPRMPKSISNPEIDRDLANKYPLTFLVAEDNKINRKLLVSMLNKFGYKAIHEAHDGTEAVRQMKVQRKDGEKIDIVLMDLWMPLMDGYEATERILDQYRNEMDDGHATKPTVLAVTADVTDGAQERAARVGMKGFMTKPYKIHDLQRLITEYCAQRKVNLAMEKGTLPVAVEG